MQSSPVLTIGLPVVVFIIMLGLGLTLRLSDFSRVLARPKWIAIGLACQVIVLPIVCLGIVYLSDLPPAIAVGMMLLAACPGGTSAILYTHLARGEVALSITLVALGTLLALATVPIIANASLALFFGEAAAVYLSFGQVLLLFALALVPALIGALLRERRPAMAARLERPVTLVAVLFLALVIVAALVAEWDLVVQWAPVVGATALAFNLASMAIGFGLASLLGLSRGQSTAIAMSMSVRNAALVIALALSPYMLNDAEMGIGPAIYGLLAYFTAAAGVWLMKPRVAAV